ncbi:unnamed protein product [Schistosoma margrebowiei]|uniref:Uncharacterized protein n=1 Tax=Schistosoma margrebowiei TaxID=48269 RepID=A0A183MYQ1_9TREM|nr:unnamed protein product [Schistosoma margrebowiei]
MALLTTRATIDLGTWNARTMWKSSKLLQKCTDTTWWCLGSVKHIVRKLDNKDYSGHEEENGPYTQGVLPMLSKQAQKALIGWESHGPGIIKASFETKKEGIAMNIIQCYVPNNDYNEHVKNQFYDELQSIVEKCPTKDLTILMGDLNTKVGMDITRYEDIMGRHGLGGRKENVRDLQTYVPSIK